MPLSPRRQRLWLRQHIRSRVFAMHAQPKLVKVIQDQQPVTATASRHALEAIFHATWEGRLAATRWLIDFVGVVGYRKGRPVIWDAKHKGQPYDFRITDLPGGTPIDSKTATATKLASLRRAISKATGHATDNSRHAKITEERLRIAADALVAHLQKTVYKTAHETL